MVGRAKYIGIVHRTETGFQYYGDSSLVAKFYGFLQDS